MEAHGALGGIEGLHRVWMQHNTCKERSSEQDQQSKHDSAFFHLVPRVSLLFNSRPSELTEYSSNLVEKNLRPVRRWSFCLLHEISGSTLTLL